MLRAGLCVCVVRWTLLVALLVLAQVHVHKPPSLELPLSHKPLPYGASVPHMSATCRNPTPHDPSLPLPHLPLILSFSHFHYFPIISVFLYSLLTNFLPTVRPRHHFPCSQRAISMWEGCCAVKLGASAGHLCVCAHSRLSTWGSAMLMKYLFIQFSTQWAQKCVWI